MRKEPKYHLDYPTPMTFLFSLINGYPELYDGSHGRLQRLMDLIESHNDLQTYAFYAACAKDFKAAEPKDRTIDQWIIQTKIINEIVTLYKSQRLKAIPTNLALKSHLEEKSKALYGDNCEHKVSLAELILILEDFNNTLIGHIGDSLPAPKYQKPEPTIIEITAAINAEIDTLITKHFDSEITPYMRELLTTLLKERTKGKSLTEFTTFINTKIKVLKKMLPGEILSLYLVSIKKEIFDVNKNTALEEKIANSGKSIYKHTKAELETYYQAILVKTKEDGAEPAAPVPAPAFKASTSLSLWSRAKAAFGSRTSSNHQTPKHG